MNYGGVTTASANAQNNPLNMLSWSLANHQKHYNVANSIRYNMDLSRKGYDNTFNQLNAGYNPNGGLYQQLFKLPSVKIFNRDQDDNGRNLNIFKYTNERMVDVSGLLWKAQDIPKRPLTDERNFKNEYIGFVK